MCILNDEYDDENCGIKNGHEDMRLFHYSIRNAMSRATKGRLGLIDSAAFPDKYKCHTYNQFRLVNVDDKW